METPVTSLFQFRIIVFLTLFFSFSTLAETNVNSSGVNAPEYITKLLPTPNGSAGDENNYGYSISIDNNHAMVGAPNMAITGLVYVYDFDGFNWVFTTTLRPENHLGVEARFGNSVSLSNNRVLIGAPSINDSLGRPSGSAFVFELINGVWEQTHELYSIQRAASDHFGESVSLLNDRALIGSYKDFDSMGFGAAFIYDFVAGDWVETQKLIPTDGSYGDYFGYSVDLSLDRIIIGAYKSEEAGLSNNGSAYIYDLNNGVWTQTQKLTANNKNDNDYFGIKVSLDNSQALIGATGNDMISDNAGAAYIFDYDGNTWTQSELILPTLNNIPKNFGASVKIVNNHGFIGSLSHDNNGVNSGALYSISKSNGQWLQSQIIIPSDGETGDSFGFIASLSNSSLFVSSLYDNGNGIKSGCVYTFTQNNGIWQQSQKITSNEPIGATKDRFGISVSYQGNRIAIGSHLDDGNGYNAGSVYIFDLINNSWALSQKITTTIGIENEYFGYSVSLDGDKLLVGAPQRVFLSTDGVGSAYVFELINGVWTQSQKINANNGMADTYFGYSVSLSQDRALIGAYADDNGSAYIFNLNQGSWVQVQKLQPENNLSYTKFGYSVDLENNRLIIGAPRKDNGPSTNGNYRRGAAYVFDYINSQWELTQKLYDSQEIFENIYADFGSSVSLFNNRVAIGARYDEVGNIVGSAHVFDFNNAEWIHTQKLFANKYYFNFNFGQTISLYGDKIVVGASLTNNFETRNYSGAAFVFDLKNQQWLQTIELNPYDGQYHDYFGRSVSLFGNKVLVGANSNSTESGTDSGAAYLVNFGVFVFSNSFE